MDRIRSSFAVLAVVGFLAAAPLASAQQTHQHIEVVFVEPLTRNLGLVADEKGGLSLASDRNPETYNGPRTGTYVVYRPIGVSCSQCYTYKTTVKAPYVDEDFDMEVTPSFKGFLAMRWNVRSTLYGTSAIEPRPYADVFPSLYLDGVTYVGRSIPIDRTDGEFRGMIEFNAQEVTIQSKPKGNASQAEHGDDPPSHATHDALRITRASNLTLALTIALRSYGTVWDSLGRQVTVTVNAAGESYVTVHEAPPPPPEPEPVEPIDEDAEAVPIGFQYTDKDGDGRMELHFVPGFEAVLMGLALVTGLLGYRRFKK